jgi:hypothetical protein
MSAWVGRKMRDTNMTTTGETEATEIFDLFKMTNTLSEFNSPTYTGVSLYGLTLWSKYLPRDSILTRAGPEMIKLTWETFAQQWHFGMKNVAGPWDRGYGFDMQRYVTMMGMWLWALNGRENSGMTSRVCLFALNLSSQRLIRTAVSDESRKRLCLWTAHRRACRLP